MTVSHTPGPWKVLVDAEHAANRRIGCLIRPHVAKVYALSPDEDPVCIANALLIAAAPELLEALQLARQKMLGASPSMKALIAKTDAAIAKATGQ